MRLGLFSNVGFVANNREIVTLTQIGAFDDINTAAFVTSKPRRKTGGYVNLEQALTPDLGLFARASLNDGRTTSLSFTDIDQSFSGGLSLKGTGWGRPGEPGRQPARQAVRQQEVQVLPRADAGQRPPECRHGAPVPPGVIMP